MGEIRKISKRNAIRQENEARILLAAEKVFAVAGYGGATMQLIADMAGLPKANLHYYFPTKEELYRKVVQQIFEIWLHAADSFDDAPGPVEGIGAYIDAKSDIIFDIYRRCGLYSARDLQAFACSVLNNRYNLRVREIECKPIQTGISLCEAQTEQGAYYLLAWEKADSSSGEISLPQIADEGTKAHPLPTASGQALCSTPFAIFALFASEQDALTFLTSHSWHPTANL